MDSQHWGETGMTDSKWKPDYAPDASNAHKIYKFATGKEHDKYHIHKLAGGFLVLASLYMFIDLALSGFELQQQASLMHLLWIIPATINLLSAYFTLPFEAFNQPESKRTRALMAISYPVIGITCIYTNIPVALQAAFILVYYYKMVGLCILPAPSPVIRVHRVLTVVREIGTSLFLIPIVLMQAGIIEVTPFIYDFMCWQVLVTVFIGHTQFMFESLEARKIIESKFHRNFTFGTLPSAAFGMIKVVLYVKYFDVVPWWCGAEIFAAIFFGGIAPTVIIGIILPRMSKKGLI